MPASVAGNFEMLNEKFSGIISLIPREVQCCDVIFLCEEGLRSRSSTEARQVSTAATSNPLGSAASSDPMRRASGSSTSWQTNLRAFQ